MKPREIEMGSKRKEVRIIPREKAVFRLDRNGRWQHEGGPFRHRRIIQHFHRSIRRDPGGYFLLQDHGEFLEKVYFPVEDTALFVFDRLPGEGVRLRLNTGHTIRLKPRCLLLKGEDLYMEDRGERIKFVERGLLAVADLIEEVDGAFYIHLKGRRHRIREELRS